MELEMSFKLNDYPGGDSLFNLFWKIFGPDKILERCAYYADKGVTNIDDLAEYLMSKPEIALMHTYELFID